MRPHGRVPAAMSGRLRFTILAVTVAAFLLIPVAHAAAFMPSTVTVKIVGTGKGEVVSNLPGQHYKGTPPLECKYVPGKGQSGTCKNSMGNEGEGWEQVLMTAKAGESSHFVKWTVEGVESEACGTFVGCGPFVEPAEVFEEEGTVTAEFACNGPPEECKGCDICSRLTVDKSGEGTVVADPAGIICGSICEAEFEPGQTITLLASPAADWAFSGWSGCTEQVGLTCKVKMEKAKTIRATFVATPLLTVEKAGSGYGKVSAMGIGCDESCLNMTAGIKASTSVTVKTTPAKGSEAAVIEGGTGSASACSGSTCTFTISEASSVKVKFNPIPTKTLTVKLTGPGAYKGKVAGKGVTVKGLVSTAINCGAGCREATESFFAIGETELVAMPASGYTFAGWIVSGGSAGTCTGTTSPCKLLTDADKTAVAEFK